MSFIKDDTLNEIFRAQKCDCETHKYDFNNKREFLSSLLYSYFFCIFSMNESKDH